MIIKFGGGIFVVGLVTGIIKVFTPQLPVGDGLIEGLMISGVLLIGLGVIADVLDKKG
jgi:hypothetical protein